MEFNIQKVVETATSIGLVKEPEATDLTKLIGLMLDVRDKALEEAAKLCHKEAEYFHLRMHRSKDSGFVGATMTDATRRDVAEVLKVRIRSLRSGDPDVTSQDAQAKGSYTSAAAQFSRSGFAQTAQIDREDGEGRPDPPTQAWLDELKADVCNAGEHCSFSLTRDELYFVMEHRLPPTDPSCPVDRRK